MMTGCATVKGIALDLSMDQARSNRFLYILQNIINGFPAQGGFQDIIHGSKSDGTAC